MGKEEKTEKKRRNKIEESRREGKKSLGLCGSLETKEERKREKQR